MKGHTCTCLVRVIVTGAVGGAVTEEHGPTGLDLYGNRLLLRGLTKNVVITIRISLVHILLAMAAWDQTQRAVVHCGVVYGKPRCRAI